MALQADTTLPAKVSKALQPIVYAIDHPATVRENIEDWYDSCVDRASGVYKRRSHLIVVIIGRVLTINLNVESVALVRELSTDRPMRDSLVAAATEYAKANPTPTPKPTSSANVSPTPTPTPTASATPKATPPNGASNAGTTSSASPQPS